MSVEFVSGDLFKNEYACDAFSHGCNTIGAMGAGIASGFKQRYPQMYDQYKWLCQSKQFNPGDVFFWFEPFKPSVLNLASQVGVGSCAKLEYIEKCFERIESRYNDWGIKKLAMPRIGAGLGGLDWQDVKSLIEKIFTNSRLVVMVYESF